MMGKVIELLVLVVGVGTALRTAGLLMVAGLGFRSGDRRSALLACAAPVPQHAIVVDDFCGAIAG
jgi:hypothetical protein